MPPLRFHASSQAGARLSLSLEFFARKSGKEGLENKLLQVFPAQLLPSLEALDQLFSFSVSLFRSNDFNIGNSFLLCFNSWQNCLLLSFEKGKNSRKREKIELSCKWFLSTLEWLELSCERSIACQQTGCGRLLIETLLSHCVWCAGR